MANYTSYKDLAKTEVTCFNRLTRKKRKEKNADLANSKQAIWETQVKIETTTLININKSPLWSS